MSLVLIICASGQAADKIKVLVWDEQQPEQKQAYDGGFLGEHLARYLKKYDDLEVSTAKLKSPDQGLATKDLEAADVLVYWSHKKQRDISEAKGREIAALVKAGKLNFIVLHSAHWSVPFMACMQAKAAEDALARLSPEDRKKAKVIFKGKMQWRKRKAHTREQGRDEYIVKGDVIEVHVERPNCVFQRCCTPVQPSQIRILNPKHPIAKGLPRTFTIPHTEMYDEPYGVPTPDELIMDETWKGGEYFRSAMIWHLGKGQVFYFRPGHETYDVFKQENCLKVVLNAVRHLGAKK